MWRGLRERHGQVNVLINNAARSMGRRISELKVEDVRKTIEINFLSIV
jgi:short-subunit dehydrogenase